MDAFNCVKPPQAKDGLPPLPRGSRRSLKSTITCGITSTTPLQNESKRLASPPVMHDPFAYNSVAMTRDLFRGFILQRKDSLTKQEHRFLENLVEDGEEDDFNSAMMVLSDRQLFFHRKNWGFEESASRLLGCASMSPLSRNDSDSQLNDIDITHKKQMSPGARGSGSPSSTTSNKESHQDEEHFEIVDTGHGAIILQDLERRPYSEKSRAKSDDATIESPQFQSDKVANPMRNHQRSISEPHTAQARIGTPHRQRRVAERKQSSVHSSMWKAYTQGLSLTPNSSFQSSKDYKKSLSLNKNQFKCQHNVTSSPYRYVSRHSRKSSKAKIRGPTPFDSLRGSESSALSKQMSELRGSDASIQKWNAGASWAATSDYDVPPVNAVRHDGGYSRPLGSDDILNRGMGANSSFKTDNLWSDKSTSSSIPALNFADSIHSYGSDTLPKSIYSGRQSPSHRVSQSSLTSFPSLQRGYSFGGSLSHNFHNLPSTQMSDNCNESSQSIPSLHHGKSLNESLNSNPSIHPPQPLRQVSSLSIASNTLQLRRRESGQWSAASSATLNSLEIAYDLEKEKSSTSNGSLSSFRHSPPMRPTRSPSPYISRPKLTRRSVSDGELPPRQSSITEDKTPKKMPSSTPPNFQTNILPRRKSIAGKCLSLLSISNRMMAKST